MPDKPEKQKGIAPYAHLLSLGIEMGVAMLFPVLLGWYAEKHWDISPWGIVVGALFGFICAFWLVYKRVILEK